MTHEDETSDQPEGVESTSVPSRCLDAVEQYRMSKGDAIYEFTKTIPADTTETAESPGKTLESYISMLDNWDHERTLSDTDVHRGGDSEESQ